MKQITIDPKLLQILRRLAIQLVRACDEALGLPQTIPTKAERRQDRGHPAAQDG